MSMHMLIINPGSTSTKAALFDGDKMIAEDIVRHDAKELMRFGNVADSLDYRMTEIDSWIDALKLQPGQIKAVIGRGAPVRPLEGGSYEINESMLNDLKTMRYSNHASNLGGIIAHHLGQRFGVPSLISDPITTDNFTDLARVSGLPEIERKCRAHALNIKEVCRREALKSGKKLEDVNYVAVHMGGGITVAALHEGKIIDCNDALLGMGPFSPDRAGALPIGGLVKLCYSGKFTQQELLEKLSRKAGLQAYIGVSDLREAEKLVDAGDPKAPLYLNAMAYQIAKEIGAIAAALCGQFEAIVLTGGMAHSERMIEQISKHVSFLGRIVVVPGEFEMEALAAAGIRFLTGQEKLKVY